MHVYLLFADRLTTLTKLIYYKVLLELQKYFTIASSGNILYIKKRQNMLTKDSTK